MSVSEDVERSSKDKTGLSYDPASPLLGFYPREMKTYVHTKTYTRMFIATLFIVQSGNNPNIYQQTNG